MSLGLGIIMDAILKSLFRQQLTSVSVDFLLLSGYHQVYYFPGREKNAFPMNIRFKIRFTFIESQSRENGQNDIMFDEKSEMKVFLVDCGKRELHVFLIIFSDSFRYDVTMFSSEYFLQQSS